MDNLRAVLHPRYSLFASQRLSYKVRRKREGRCSTLIFPLSCGLIRENLGDRQVFLTHMVYQFKNATVLVVDDMQPMLSLCSSLLKIFGFEKVYLAKDADEGFDMFVKHNPDIVLTDWLMEPYDGTQLI